MFLPFPDYFTVGAPHHIIGLHFHDSKTKKGLGIMADGGNTRTVERDWLRSELAYHVKHLSQPYLYKKDLL